VILRSPMDPPAVIFEDGFETGDFSAWTGTIVSAGQNISVESLNPHHGLYNAKVTMVNAGLGYKAYCYKDLGITYPLIFERLYVKFDTISYDPGSNCHVLALGQTEITDRVAAGVADDAGVDKWWLQHAGDGWAPHFGSPVSTGIWYAVEIEYDYAAGVIKLYVNGSADITLTGQTTYSDIRWAKAGVVYSGPGNSCVYFVDCVVVADEYIGPEVPPPVEGVKAMFGGLYLVYPA